MVSNDSRTKGDIAEKLFELECLKRGIAYFIPGNSNTRIDYVINDSSGFKRVQIKYISATTKGTINISFTKSQNGRLAMDGKPKYLKYDLEEIDLFIVYCPNTNKFYSIPLNEYSTQRGINLRLSDKVPINGNLKLVNFASKFEW